MAPRKQGLWTHRDFLKLWSGQTISIFGSLIGRIALPMMVVLVLDADSMQVGLLRAVEVAPGMLAGLFAGLWVDRLRRKPIMIAADVGRALLTAAIPALYLLGNLRMSWVYVIACLVSVLTILFDVAYQAYLPTLVDADRLVEANSRLEATSAVAEVTGFGIAGALVQILTGPITVLIDAISFVFSAVSIAWIRSPEPPPPPAEHRQSSWVEIREGISALFGHPVLRALAVASGIDNLFGNIIGTVIMLFVLRELNLSPALSGVIFSIGGISSFFGAMLSTRVVGLLGLGPAIIVAAFVGVVASGFVPLAQGSLVMVVTLLIAQQLFGDGAMTMYLINATSLRQTVTPERLMGRVGATLRVTEWSFMLIGTLLGGVLGELIGLRGALWVATAGKLLSVIWLYFSPVRSLKRQPEAA